MGVIDLAAIRAAATAARQAVQQAAPRTQSDPFDRLAASVESICGIAAQLGTNLAALEDTVARQAADIAKLTEGFAALARMMTRPTGETR
jgi:hypothetical protein